MATDGDIIEIVDRQTTNPDLALNVYHYRIDCGILTVPPLTIATFWWGNCNAVIRGLQMNDLLHIRVSCKNLENPADYAEYIVPTAQQAGLNTAGETQSRQAAIGVTFRGSTVVTRPGSKRVCGVPEAASGDWGALVPAFITAATDYGSHMASSLNSLSPPFVLVPVILGLPNSERPTRVENPVSGFVVNPYVTSQNTRKIGRGA